MHIYTFTDMYSIHVCLYTCMCTCEWYDVIKFICNILCLLSLQFDGYAQLSNESSVTLFAAILAVSYVTVKVRTISLYTFMYVNKCTSTCTFV